MSGIHILMINPNDGAEVPDDVFRYNVPDEFQMGKHRLSGEVIECSMQELTGINETFIICQICFKIMHQPSALPCLHAFCLKCLYRFVSDYGMACPLCMQPFDAPGRDLAQLPRSSFIYHNLCVAVAGQQIDNAPCKICKLKPDEFCLHCDAYLCELCSIVCHRMNGKNNHDVMRLSKYKEMITEKKPDCANHNILASGFCDKCKILICEKCDGHKIHTIKDVDYGVAYFKKSTDDLVVRYPYEKSLLYKKKKENGQPIYAPAHNEPNRYHNLDSKYPPSKCCKKSLTDEEIEQLKKDLANKSLPSRLSADKSVRISSFQTEDMEWEVFVPQTAEGKSQISMEGPEKLAELLNSKKPPIPIDDPKKFLELLQSNKTVLPINDPMKFAELLQSGISPMDGAAKIAELLQSGKSPIDDPVKFFDDPLNFVELLQSKLGPIPLNDPLKLAELLQSGKFPMSMEGPLKFVEHLQSQNPPISLNDPFQMAELLKSKKPPIPITDPFQLAELLQKKTLIPINNHKTLAELIQHKDKLREAMEEEEKAKISISKEKQQVKMSDRDKKQLEVRENTKAKDDGAAPVKINKDIDNTSKARRTESGWNEKLMMLNHVMGRNYTTPPDNPTEYYQYNKSPKLDSHDIDFDDVD